MSAGYASFTNVWAARWVRARLSLRRLAESSWPCRRAIFSFRSLRSLSETKPFPEIPTPTRNADDQGEEDGRQ